MQGLRSQDTTQFEQENNYISCLHLKNTKKKGLIKVTQEKKSYKPLAMASVSFCTATTACFTTFSTPAAWRIVMITGFE